MLAQPKKIWLFSFQIDIIGLFLPVWLACFACFFIPIKILNNPLPLWVWVIVVMGIDVSHVWATILRTYLDKFEFERHKKLLLFTPILVFLVLFFVVNISILWFWRVMAYLALHHFVRQQYGFLALYRAKYGIKHSKFFADKWVIYFSMLYPIFYWHFSSQRKFQWFYVGDFLNLSFFLEKYNFIWQYLHFFYFLILFFWLIEEIYYSQKIAIKKWAWGKILWILTTALAWYIGIVYFNSDIAFTLTNVIAHGVPYILLVFVYVEKKKSIQLSTSFSFWKYTKHIFLMFVCILLLAFLEEYCWDWWLNRQKIAFFSHFLSYPTYLFTDPFLKAFAFAFLSIPQVSHYIIDGYIWKNNDKNPHLKNI
ncbi:MAG: hypothetical protein EAZ44_01595 [Cytophagia bacterium]|nr:MAG: hypothetical protein EAZ44_01595 [Cytophagia bacterium]TAG43064.1 MAG: hypothetical protein EAZ31_05085 [Cytophagia bacterium]TAH30263.1 MAG: hypothetical protein EAZ06_03890 [Cytophagales bacterium]